MSEPESLFAAMVRHSEALWTIQQNGVVCQGKTMPDRETLLDDYCWIQTYTPFLDAEGGAHFGPPTQPTRAQAERSVDACCLPLSSAL